MRFHPTSLREIGLKEYLNSSRIQHNNMGYSEFINLHKAGLKGMTLARAMGVKSPKTVNKWLEIYHEEQAKKVV
jgi:hypothetical protein